jgi:hypothetical protein
LADSGHDASLQELLNTLGVSGSGIPFLGLNDWVGT